MMEASELAAKMLEWEKMKKALDLLGSEIETEVIRLEKTQVVGSVRVTYSGGRSTYDYESPALNKAPQDVISKYTTEFEVIDWEGVKQTVPDVIEEFTKIDKSVDWKLVCKEAKIDPVVLSKTPPSATIKME